MKKFVYVLLFGCLFSLQSLATNPVNPPASNDYFIDDQKIEQLFASSVDVSLTASSASLITDNAASNGIGGKNAFYAPGEKNFAAALLLNLFLGGLGIHRLY